MMDGATKAFVQGYNAQIAVDSQAQIIVACAVTQGGQRPAAVGAHGGTDTNKRRNASRESIGGRRVFSVPRPSRRLCSAGSTCWCPPDRKKLSDRSRDDIGECSEASSSPSEAEKMRQKLRAEAEHDLYRMRKAIVEPVFGQTKEARGFRRFLLRGVENGGCEFDLISLTHNLLKLFRASACVRSA
jgi:hypothetical protein